MNRRAELLSQGSMTLKAGTVDNTVGKIRGAGDVSITATKVENKGKAGDLTKYRVYWETWNGKKYNSLAEVNAGWKIHPVTTKSGSTEDKEATFDYLTDKFSEKNGDTSYIFNKLKEVVRQKKYTESGTIQAASSEYPEVPLKNKVESEAKTEFAIISGGNLSINASGEVNNTDGIISSDGLTKIDSPRIVNRVTIDTNNPVMLTDGVEKLSWWKTGKKKKKYPVNYERFLVPSSEVGYVAGQPSVIEGRAVILDTGSIVAESYESAKGKIVTGNPSHSGIVAGQNIQVVKNVSSIEEIKRTGVISVNPAPVSGNSGTGNTGRVEGWNNLLTVSGLYIPSARPDSKYIVESRAEFTNISGFYGSEYFLDRAGFKEDWNRTKLLGDAYYESLLVEQMLTEKLGTRYINGMSGSELMKSLIDNAVSAGKDLNLGQGVALTREQINGLKNDILWYEYQTVNGVRTLVPKIYLSKATLERLETDGRSRIYGTDFTVISSGKEINNRGQKIGSDTGITLIKGSRVTNEMLAGERGEIAGRQIQIEASAGSIENIGGKISGEEINLIAKKGSIVNDGVKQRNGYQIDRNNHTQYETVSNVGEITGNSVYLEANDYNTTGGALLTKNLTLNLKGDINADTMELKGNDRFGDSRNYQKYSSKEHVGSAIVTEKVTGTVGDINLRGSAFIAENGDKINIGNVRVESAVNEYDTESRSKSKGMLSSRKSYTESHTEENAAGNFKIGSNAHISGTVTSVGSNVYLGDNTYVGGKVTTDSRQLHNSYYHEESRRGFNASAGKGSVSAGYGKNESTYRETGTLNAKSTLHVGNNSVLNNGAEITATDFEHGKIEINNGNVIYGARKNTKDVTSTSKSTNIGITAKVTSPALDRIKQAEGAVKQAKEGDYTGGTVNAINFVTGTISGLAGNQGNVQRSYDSNGSVGKKGVKEAVANNDFYGNININAAFNKSKSESSSHTESAVVTTITGIDKDSSITYNNVDNIMYKGTQAKDTKFVYNDVKNITKESVELHNSYRSSSKSFGVSAGATVGYGHKLQITGNGGNISAGRSNLNTDETIHHNGSFTNVDEVHNNTGTMIIRGFNQEGGKVTGNIGKVEVISRQNTSTTTGSSKGVNLGISANGVPSSVTINASRTNGNRAFVDNQSTFVVGEGSNLHVGTVENTGAVIGKEGNSTFKIDTYVGKNIQNYDTMTTTGGSIGVSLGGNPKITNVGFNQDSRDKQGITRNTVVGDVEITKAEGSPINRDLGKANEVTKDTHRSTNINVESQTIEYLTNPGKLKEDIGKAKKEISDVTTAIKESINDRGDDNRNFFGQLREVRLNETVNNIAGKRLNEADKSEDVVAAWKDAYKDLGYNLDVKYTTGEDTPEMKDKAGTAYVSKDGVHTIIININAKKNSTKAGLIGTLAEEASHIVNGVAGRQIATGTDEKGLESTGRAANAYFKEEYKGSNQNMTYTSDGKIDTSKLGVHVGDNPEYEDIFTIKNTLYKGLNDNQIVDKVGKDYDWENLNYRDLVENMMEKDHGNSLLGYITDNIKEKVTIGIISNLARKFLIEKGFSSGAATKAGGLIALGLFTANEVSKLKEFRNFGSNGRAALILALGKEKERDDKAIETANWYRNNYLVPNFYKGGKKISNENNIDVYIQVENLLFTKSYENWSKEQQNFFKEAIKSSGKEKETEKIIKIQKLLYRYNYGGSYKDEKGKNIYYPAGSPNWFNNRKMKPNWTPYNGM